MYGLLHIYFTSNRNKQKTIENYQSTVSSIALSAEQYNNINLDSCND